MTRRSSHTPAPKSRRPSPYWSLERRYVLLVRAHGHQGATIRRLRAANHRLHVLARAERRRHRRALRTLASYPFGVDYAIRLAASAYRLPEADMRAVASCETGGSFSPSSYNAGSGASGLFQWLPSTWASDGLAGFSVFDPLANAVAAARLVVKDGGWSEWSCKP